MNDNNIIIKTENLCKFYNGEEIKALNNVSSEIKEGEVVVVIGPSGSGKSTFLRSLNLLEEPTSGKIYFEGVDITDPKTNINLHRQKMGMVFQQFNLFPHMTVLRNLTIAPMKLLKMDKKEAEEKAMALTKSIMLFVRISAYYFKGITFYFYSCSPYLLPYLIQYRLLCRSHSVSLVP